MSAFIFPSSTYRKKCQVLFTILSDTLNNSGEMRFKLFVFHVCTVSNSSVIV